MPLSTTEERCEGFPQNAPKLMRRPSGNRLDRWHVRLMRTRLTYVVPRMLASLLPEPKQERVWLRGEPDNGLPKSKEPHPPGLDDTALALPIDGLAVRIGESI